MFLLSTALSKETIFYHFVKNGLEKKIKIDEPLKKYTSYKVGGPVDFYCIPENIKELKTILSIAARENIPYILIGNGTNLLIRDKGIRGIVIQLGKGFKKVALSDKILKVGAGIGLSYVSKFAFHQNLSGLEFAYNIPGTIGGAIKNNAGFKRSSMADIVHRITILTKENKIKKIPRSNLRFYYRNCDLSENTAIIIEAEFKLEIEKKEKIRSKIEENIKFRLNKQPLNYCNAGSVFKNPKDHFAGELIEKAGAKGLSKGQAEVSKIHANFIINKGNASANDILYLINEIENRVQGKFGIRLEREIEIIGEE